MTDWDRRYFDLAGYVSSWSKDPSTKVGAVIVGKDKREVAVGYNGFPPGIEDLQDRLNDRYAKYRFTQHAERNVLDNARFDVQGGTLYVTMFPCSECAKSIVSKGIRRIICPPPSDRQPWAEDSAYSRIMFCEAGVDVKEKINE